MKIISLSSDKAGFACAVATSIKKYYNNNYQTNLFDYLVCNLNDINNLLEFNNIDLLTSNLNISQIDNKSIVNFENFENLISYHDLNNPYSIEDYTKFIEKLKRRFYRFIELIKNEDIIYFVRYGKENENILNNFFINIKKINSKLKVFLLNVYYDEYNKSYLCKKSNIIDSIIPINFYTFEKKNTIYNKDDYYKTLEYNWHIIFKLIEELNAKKI